MSLQLEYLVHHRLGLHAPAGEGSSAVRPYLVFPKAWLKLLRTTAIWEPHTDAATPNKGTQSV